MNSKAAVTSLIKKIVLTSMILAAVAAVVSLALGHSKFALSIGMGWIISVTSFSVLCITIYSAFMKNHTASIVAAVIGIAKLIILGLALWYLITKGYADPLAFMAGFGSTVLALMIEGFRMKSHGSIA